MNTALFIKHFQRSILISIEEASKKIQDLNINLQTIQTYCNHHQETLTEKEQQQQKEKTKKIQDEIDYYETLIWRSQEQPQVPSPSTKMDDNQVLKVSDYGSAHVEVSNNNFYGAGEHLDDKDPIKIKIIQITRLMAEVEAELQAKL